jgi:hypothetical protein
LAANSKVRLHALCEEKQRLRVLYSQAVDGHSSAVDAVLLARGKASKQDYDRARALGDQARAARDFARTALEQHKQQHGC